MISLQKVRTAGPILLAVTGLLLGSLPNANAQVLRPLKGIFGNVRGVYTQEGELWFCTSEGLFTSRAGYEATKTLAEPCRCIRNVRDDELLFCASKGVLKISEGNPDRVQLGDVDDQEVFFIVPDPLLHSAVFFGTNKGVYFQEARGKNARRILPDGQRAESTSFLGATADGSIWVSTLRRVLQRQGDVFIQRGNIENVVEVISFNNEYFLRTFPFDPVAARLMARYTRGKSIEVIEHGVLDIAALDDGLWLSSRSGQLFKWSKIGGSTPIDGLNARDIHFIGKTREFHWAVSKDAILFCYRCDGLGYDFQVLAYDYDRFGIQSAFEHDGDVWLWGASGAYRIFADSNIDIRTNVIRDEEGRASINGRVVRLEHISYDRSRNFPREVMGKFQAAIWPDRSKFENEKRDFSNTGKFVDWKMAQLEVSPGLVDVFVAVRDDFSNVKYLEIKNIRVTEDKTKPGFLQLLGKFGLWLLALPLLPSIVSASGYLLSGLRRMAPSSRRSLFLRTVDFPNPRRLVFVPLSSSILHRLHEIDCADCCREFSHESGVGKEVIRETKRRADHIYVLDRSQVAAVGVDTLRSDILCGGYFSCTFPLVVSCEELVVSVNWEDIRNSVLERLMVEYESSDETFFREFLLRGKFVFLFTLRSVSESDPVASAIRAFFRGRERESYLMLIPVGGSGSEVTTKEAKRRPRKRRSKDKKRNGRR